MGKKRVTEKDNFIWLLFGLIFLLFSAALLKQLQLEEGLRLVNVSVTAALLAAVWAIETQHRWMASRIGASIAIIALMTLSFFMRHEGLDLLQLVFMFCFVGLTVITACRQVLFTGDIDGNKIIGAICIYIMLGLLWTFGFLIVEQLAPGSISGLGEGGWHQKLQDVVYYSFITLTTVGYGEIAPIAPISRFLAYLEAITGQFYIAILVASLIGARFAGGSEQSGSAEQS